MKFFDYYLSVVETLIATNVLIFIITLIDPKSVIFYFGLIPLFVLEHPWTVVTSMFLHGGFDHILFNMITLFFFGLYLEQLVGEKDFLKIYFLGGLAGSLMYVLLASNSLIPAIGASGAIFAIGGALAVLRPNMQVLLFFFVPMPLWIAVIGGFFIMSLVPGIAWEGHLGGLIVGLISGYYLKKKIPMIEIGSGSGQRYGYRF